MAPDRPRAVKRPTFVSDELTTFAASVVPVRVPAAATADIVHAEPSVHSTPLTVVPEFTRSAFVISPVAVSVPVTVSPAIVPRLVILPCTAAGSVAEIDGTPEPSVTSVPLFAVDRLPRTAELIYSNPFAVPLAIVVVPTVIVPADELIVQVDPSVQMTPLTVVLELASCAFVIELSPSVVPAKTSGESTVIGWATAAEPVGLARSVSAGIVAVVPERSARPMARSVRKPVPDSGVAQNWFGACAAPCASTACVERTSAASAAKACLIASQGLRRDLRESAG